MNSYWGQLTDLGRRSTLDMGKRLRDLYVPLGFLPATLTRDTSAQVAFRSTNMPRTIESLHQLIEGMWPSRAREEGLKVEFKLRGWMDEDLYPNTSCGCVPACLAVVSACGVQRAGLDSRS